MVGGGDGQIKTEEPGAGLDSRNDLISDCVVGERVNKRASFAYVSSLISKEATILQSWDGGWACPLTASDCEVP